MARPAADRRACMGRAPCGQTVAKERSKILRTSETFGARTMQSCTPRLEGASRRGVEASRRTSRWVSDRRARTCLPRARLRARGGHLCVHVAGGVRANGRHKKRVSFFWSSLDLRGPIDLPPVGLGLNEEDMATCEEHSNGPTNAWKSPKFVPINIEGGLALWQRTIRV